MRTDQIRGMSLVLASGLFGLVILCAPPATAEPSLDKDAAHLRLAELEDEVAATRAALAADPDNEALEVAVAGALAEQETISSLLGGDRPVPFTIPSVSTADSGPVSQWGNRKVSQESPARFRFPRLTLPRPGPVVRILAVPASCTSSTTTFSNTTPVAIPTGPAVVSSTVLVSGADSFLWNATLTTTLSHSFAADLDITVTSPAGTVVTLTTDNGGVNDNVFLGTLWSDQADPGGQVPYVTNDGLATDHPYANVTVATPLVPEEAMAAFFGEDPNGTWTITISDDLGGDSGELTSWSLELTTLTETPALTTTTFISTTPLAIADTAVQSQALAVAGLDTTLARVEMDTRLAHTFPADLDITLASPAGTVMTLTTDNGAGNVGVFDGTHWSDKANPGGQVPYVTNDGLVTDSAYVNNVVETPLVPEEAFGAFLGENPNGNWTITISDDLGGDTGTLASWSLSLTTASCDTCVITCSANLGRGTDPGVCERQLSYDAPTTTGSCGTVTCDPPSGSTFPLGPTTVTCSTTAGPSCNFTVTVYDVEAPTGEITFPAGGECFGPGSLPVTITDNFTDNCDASLTRTYSPGPGPSYSAEGDYNETLTVEDNYFRQASDSVAFRIDTTSPVVQITSPSADQTGSWPLTNTVNVAFSASDNDAASGGPVHETIDLEGCVIYDGNIEGDHDGLLSDELMQLTRYNLCQFMNHCHFNTLEYPTIYVRSTDACGNTGVAARVLRRRFIKTDLCFP